jgi:hypothetical protein
MMNVRRGLYKGWTDMPNSGALSAAPQNGVDADAADRAPIEGQQTHRGWGGNLARQKMVDIWPAVTTWNASFERHRSQLATLPRSCGRWQHNKTCCQRIPRTRGDSQL